MSLRPSLLLLGLLAAVLPFGCGTGVTGINDCRDIEEARCEAAAACGTLEDVDACKRFYRDHCLHGLPGQAPAEDELGACVTALRRAGECAAQSGADTSPGDCRSGEPSPALESRFETVCDLVARPEDSVACSFLNSSSDPAQGGAGGDDS